MQNIFNQAFGQQPGGYTYGANLGDTSQNAYNLWGFTGQVNPYIARAGAQAPLIPQNVFDVLPGGDDYYNWNNIEKPKVVDNHPWMDMDGQLLGGYSNSYNMMLHNVAEDDWANGNIN